MALDTGCTLQYPTTAFMEPMCLNQTFSHFNSNLEWPQVQQMQQLCLGCDCCSGAESAP